MQLLKVVIDITVSSDDDSEMHYPGGKAKSFHHIVNRIPPHKVYIEPFLGIGSVMRAKKPAEREYGIDLDESVLELSGLRRRGVRLIHDDGISFLQRFPFAGHEVVYCDPPYFPNTRARDRVYKFDMDKEDHVRLLGVITSLNAQVLVSGYDNEVYRDYLSNWHVSCYSVKTHHGSRTESLWHNFPTPSELHDYRYLGSNFRERQTIQRRLERIKRRLSDFTKQERSLLREWLRDEEKPNAN